MRFLGNKIEYPRREEDEEDVDDERDATEHDATSHMSHVFSGFPAQPVRIFGHRQRFQAEVIQELAMVHNRNEEDEFMMRSSYVIYESIDIAKKAGEDEKGDRRKTGEEAETACGWEGANNREG